MGHAFSERRMIDHEHPKQETQTTHLGRKPVSEIRKLPQLISHIDPSLSGLIQQHRQQRLRPACVLDRLRRKEEIVGSSVVEGTVLRDIG